MGSITIKLMSDLCVGNGESVGYGIDSDICADNYGFPYIPGKRILGCLRESMVQLGEYGLKDVNETEIDNIFGNANGLEGKLSVGNATISGVEALQRYILSLKKENKRDYLIRQCTEEKIMRTYSSVRGQTRINEESGKAENGSLRFIRVLNQYDPMNGNELEFTCPIDVSNLTEKQIEFVEKSCLALRHIGLNRNRGLGNILITTDLSTNNENNKTKIDDNSTGKTNQVQITYQVEFDSPITIQEYMEDGGQIKARTMIGIFAGKYLNKYKQTDENFNNLFLNGSVKWSALSPVINGYISQPVPSMIMKLKNDGGKLVNVFTDTDADWKKKKPKNIDGYFASFDEKTKNLYVAQPEMETNYHNRMSENENADRTKKGLYMQEALKQGMIYGGTITLPKSILPIVKELLSDKNIKLGRSKKAQYGKGNISKVEINDFIQEKISLRKEEVVIALLRSDLILQANAAIQTNVDFVRKEISNVTGLENSIPKEMNDICRYHVITGFHNQWHMQKPKVQAVMGGSVYCFNGKVGEYPRYIVLGEYQQEGMGVIELIPMHQLKSMSNISYGTISTKTVERNTVIENNFKQMLLYEAALLELQEYAFKYKKADDEKKYRDRVLNNIPPGKLRQMLFDATDITNLWNMVDNMKTSDVSSESKGKKENSTKLLKEFYGEDRSRFDLDKVFEDKKLLKELKENPIALNRIEKCWKEPLMTLLHMVHYEKGR